MLKEEKRVEINVLNVFMIMINFLHSLLVSLGLLGVHDRGLQVRHDNSPTIVRIHLKQGRGSNVINDRISRNYNTQMH